MGGMFGRVGVLAGAMMFASLAGIAGAHAQAGGYSGLVSTSQGDNNVNATVGYTFTANRDLAVVGLGVFDLGSNGLTQSHQVGLWNSSNQLLAFTTVTTANTLQNGFRYALLANAVGLTGGETYTVGAYFPGGAGDPYGLRSSAPATFSGITYLYSDAYISGFGNPNSPQSGHQLGGDVLLMEAPEPVSWALMIGGFGVAGVGMRRRRAQPARA